MTVDAGADERAALRAAAVRRLELVDLIASAHQGWPR
jgi:hypothetical protein